MYETLFWDVTPCSLIHRYQLLEEDFASICSVKEKGDSVHLYQYEGQLTKQYDLFDSSLGCCSCNLNTEEVDYSLNVIYIYKTTRYHIPEVRNSNFIAVRT
jgi:hypothetical protein